MSASLFTASLATSGGNRAFAKALLDTDTTVPDAITGPQQQPAPKRFSVYRNNVVCSLMEALEQTYPSLRAILGEDNFQTMARLYVSQHPPTSPLMSSYGNTLARFLKTFAPLRDAPFVVDLAVAEQCWIEAYHARDAAALSEDDLAQANPDELFKAQFSPHYATHLIASRFALYDLFNARDNPRAQAFDFTTVQTEQPVLITRKDLRVRTFKLDQSTYVFFQTLINGQTLGESVDRSMQIDQDFDASAAIALMLTSGAMLPIFQTNP